MVRAVFLCVIAMFVWSFALARPRRTRAVRVDVVRVTTVEPAPVRLLLNAGDRCDSCGHRAWFRAYYTPTRFVELCKHHRDEVPDEKFDTAIAVIDERAYVLGGGV